MSRIEAIQEYLKKSPEDAFLMHALALEYVKEGNDPLAQKTFESLLQRQPSYLGSYYHLAKLLERAEDFPKALDIYRKGMEVAKQAGDIKTYNELQNAYEDIADM